MFPLYSLICMVCICLLLWEGFLSSTDLMSLWEGPQSLILVFLCLLSVSISNFFSGCLISLSLLPCNRIKDVDIIWYCNLSE